MNNKAENSLRNSLKIKDTLRNFSLLLVIIIMVIALWIVAPVFVSSKNILNVLRQVSINGILATGMTFVILTGGIDLSVGSIIAVSSVIAGNTLAKGQPMIVAILLSLAAGLVFGLFNGIMISRFNLPPFIATLASQTIGSGIALVYSDGKPFTITNAAFLEIGRGTWLNIPIPIWLLLMVCVCAFILLNFTTFGRYIFAVGGNEYSTKLSGINTQNIKMTAYIISGILASLSAMILSSRISSGQPTSGEGYELDAIAAVAIGGTSMNGGVGSLSGTVMGFIIIGIISNALTLLNVSSFYQKIVKGVIILVAVIMDMQTKRKEN